MNSSPTKDEKPDLELLKPKSAKKDAHDESIPQAKEGKSEDVFEVARILEHLLSPDGFYMKVRWLGYGPDEDSWEPEEDLLECASECVEEYNNGLTAEQLSDIKEFKEKLAEEAAIKEAKKSAKKSAKKRESTGKSKQKTSATPEEAPKKSKRAKYEESDQESNASDKSFENKKTRRGSKKTESAPQSTKKRGKEEKTSVPTKAALKSYDVPSSAKKAAITHRQNWLDSGSDTDEDEDKNEVTFDEEIKAKLSTKKKVEPEKKKPVESTPKTAPKVVSTHKDVNEKKDRDNGVESQIVSSSTNTTNRTVKGEKSDWTIDGIVQKTVGTEKQIIVLLNNEVTGEKKTATTTEAFELGGWNLCKFLIDRCVF